MDQMSQQVEPQIDDHSGHAAGNLAATGAIALWCFSGVCYAAGSRGVGIMPYLSLASAVGVLTIIVMRLVCGGSLTDLFRVPPRVIVAGFFGVAVYSVMLGEAMGTAEKRDLGQVMLLNYLWPIWIVLLGMMLLETRAKWGLVITGAALGFGGLIVTQGSRGFSHRPNSLLPHALAFAGGFLWALYSVLLRRWRIPAERGGSTFHFTVCALLAGTIALVRGEWEAIESLHPSAAFWVLFGGIGPVGLAYHWWEIGVKGGSVHTIALLAYSIPVGSALLIGLFFHEAMSAWLLAGAVLIALGAWIGSMATRRSL
jgi:drug/metabolite transporter (DMT)-like permease